MDDATSAKTLRWLIQHADDEHAAMADTPASELQRRLTQPDGSPWLAATLRKPPFSLLDDARAALVDGRASLAEITQWRLQCKQIVGQAAAREVFLAGVAGYFFALAAALLHHRRYLSSQPLAELREILIDLATVVDEPWSSFLSRAAFVEPEAGRAPPA
jgi:hypothetical protein